VQSDAGAVGDGSCEKEVSLLVQVRAGFEAKTAKL
jgi:hypothetical protein